MNLNGLGDRDGAHRVAVIALDGVYAFELGIPSRVFGNALNDRGEPLYDVVVCTVDGRPVRTDSGFTVVAEHGPEALDTADTVVIPPTRSFDSGMEGGELPQGVVAALGRIRPGTRIVSFCNASYVLAAVGLLDGRPATTHWHVARDFQRAFPRIKVDADVLFVDDGDVLTAAGVAAGIDLCLHVVRRDHGAAVANHVARVCVVPPWRDGGQAQYIERPVPEPTLATTAATRAWALERLHEPLPLGELAAHARMSLRTFTRRFQEEVGMSPGRWLTAQRIELARQLLESSDLPVDVVAHRSGFGTGNSLRQHMRAVLGVSPVAYRRTFTAAS
ncbi:helix-turn-helix domain-containing protein [Streptomyces sp. NPDC046465]|uniref:GlxA family transcriptional regulator n=1 Tax=Streptomyces sp. NPDC046465 TaxID=3155810 RepID=UPI0033D0D172